MKIVLAPDSFKGSMTALEVCQAFQEGAARVAPHAEFVVVPMADGGEGTTEALVAATGGKLRTVEATGPLPSDRPKVTGQIGLMGDGRTAVLEMACVSGLPLVPKAKRNPLHTTTYGTGELIRAALDAGARHLIVGIGGSAPTDLGSGLAQVEACVAAFWGRNPGGSVLVVGHSGHEGTLTRKVYAEHNG